MNIELKNVKHLASMSEETMCFEATVYIDGVRACSVGNDGRGGPNRWGDHKVAKQIQQYAATLPQYQEFQFEQEDQLISDLVNVALTKKDVQRDLRTAVYFEKMDGKLSITKKLNDAQRNMIATRPAEVLAKLKAKRFLTDADEITKLLLEQVKEQV